METGMAGLTVVMMVAVMVGRKARMSVEQTVAVMVA